ncbi:MAG TPA: hypothetical protein VNU68_07215 [Verrucomicrobiae bacterium]|nr:hypothetical protein [Verrucomicrobiae bacterium]
MTDRKAGKHTMKRMKWQIRDHWDEREAYWYNRALGEAGSLAVLCGLAAFVVCWLIA